MSDQVTKIRADGLVYVRQKLTSGEILNRVENLQHPGDECGMEVALERSIAADTEI